MLSPTALAAERVVVSVPGPGNLSYLAIELIPRIGADAAEGLDLQLRHTGGGAEALNQLVTRNADFAAAGLPTVMSMRAEGGEVTAVAAVNDVSQFVLMVRADLKDRVRRIGDLRGRTIGVNTSTRQSKTTSHQLLESLLAAQGVASYAVRVVPAGQSWEEQSSLLLSGTVDAVMGDEPFAARLVASGDAYILASLGDAETRRAIQGAGFLNATLVTRDDYPRRNPARVEAMVKVLRRSLQWLDGHTPEQTADALGVKEPQARAALVASLRKYPRAFSRDGSFSIAQLKETERFFQNSSGCNLRGRSLRMDSVVDGRWAGVAR